MTSDTSPPTIIIDMEEDGMYSQPLTTNLSPKSAKVKFVTSSPTRTNSHCPLIGNNNLSGLQARHLNYDLPTNLIRKKSIALNNKPTKVRTPYVSKDQMDYFSTESESSSIDSTPNSKAQANDYFSSKVVYKSDSNGSLKERLPRNSLGAQTNHYLSEPNSPNNSNNNKILLRSRSYSYSTPTIVNTNLMRPSQNFSKLLRVRSKLLFDSSDDNRSETLSLLSQCDTIFDKVTSPTPFLKANYQSCPTNTNETSTEMNYLDYLLLPLTYSPSVFLGLILNFLNAVSYGMIVFPTQLQPFQSFGPDGVSIFLVSTFVSQFVFSLGGSGFACGFGGFMLETVPFLHLICQNIISDIGLNNQKSIVATTMVTYALTSLITGTALFVMGRFKLGSLVGFFPRHILVGCIGGVGYFLIKTALETVTKVKLNYFELGCWVQFFSLDSVLLWGTSLLLAIILKLVLRKYHSPILMPLFYLAIPIIFFTVVYILGLDLDYLRSKHWLFESPQTNKPFYSFYSNFDFSQVAWSVVYRQLPTIFALTFFGILSVPINVPAIAVSTKTDVYDLNRELIGHGWSNLLSGLFGSLPNYIVYSSSMLFYKSGGDNHLAGVLLAISTAILWTMGTGIVSYVPCIVVGSLILHLGTELFKEGVIDTYGSMSSLEYATIVIIVAVMAFFGFVEGVLVGIVLACLFFVFTYSGMKPIRNSFSGRAAISSVRRNLEQRSYLDKVSQNIHVLKLQGFMFFGTIDQVETTIRNLLHPTNFSDNRFQFLVLDFTLVTGVDFSAAECFTRSSRLLRQQDVTMVVCGIDYSTQVGDALHAVGIFDPNQPLSSLPFDSLNSALEWCENILLEKSDLFDAPESILRTESYLSTSTTTTNVNQQLSEPNSSTKKIDANGMYHQPILVKPPQPLTLLLHIFNNTQPNVIPVLHKLVDLFEPVHLPSGTILCNQNDQSDSLYLVESGILKASLSTKLECKESSTLVENILPGTMLGELSLITSSTRLYTVIVEEDCKLWKLSKLKFDTFCTQYPIESIIFIKSALAYSSQAMAILAAHAFELN